MYITTAAGSLGTAAISLSSCQATHFSRQQLISLGPQLLTFSSRVERASCFDSPVASLVPDTKNSPLGDE